MLSLPGYTFFRQLGTGARTLVYSGRRDRDGVHVVAKLCRSAVPTARELALLRHEFAILRELDMPELGRAYAIEPYEMGLAMIREHIEGRSLEALLAAAPNQRLPVISAITIAINVASTLDKIHRERVIHKDIKPSNVLVDPRTLETWLIDFGISARLSSAAQTMVAPSSLEGTLAYMSPEQTGRMNRVVDHRSDLYMLGATLYEMVTGSRPFTTNNTLELIHSHIARRPSPPHELLRSTPRSLSDIIMKLLAKAAEDRYQSGFGLERDLRRCLARPSISRETETSSLLCRSIESAGTLSSFSRKLTVWPMLESNFVLFEKKSTPAARPDASSFILSERSPSSSAS